MTHMGYLHPGWRQREPVTAVLSDSKEIWGLVIVKTEVAFSS